MVGVLLSTLGTEPQVVTLALAELERQGEPLAEVVVVHTSLRSDERIRIAISELEQAFATEPHLQTYRFRKVELQRDGRPLADIADVEGIKAFYRALHQLIRDYKRRGWRVHLNIAGGRKPMAICGMIAAQLLFDPEDRLWYLLSSPELVASRRLFPRPEDHYALIQIPVPLWSDSSPILTDLIRYDDPWEAVQAQRRLKEQEGWRRRREFLEYRLTPAERELLEVLVRHGGSSKELAARLHKSRRTVDHQFASIYRKARAFFNYSRGARIGRERLVAEFGPYFADKGVG
ncbi:MAG: CRISPR-associated ring nuclease [Candidatus Bipolaricaulia bacterium]